MSYVINMNKEAHVLSVVFFEPQIGQFAGFGTDFPFFSSNIFVTKVFSDSFSFPARALKETNCYPGVLFLNYFVSSPNKRRQNYSGSCFSLLVILSLPQTKDKTTKKKCFVHELFFHFSKTKIKITIGSSLFVCDCFSSTKSKKNKKSLNELLMFSLQEGNGGLDCIQRYGNHS